MFKVFRCSHIRRCHRFRSRLSSVLPIMRYRSFARGKGLQQGRLPGRVHGAIHQSFCSEGASLQAVDCRWSDWERWSTCSTSCGGGTKTRTLSRRYVNLRSAMRWCIDTDVRECSRTRSIAVSPMGGQNCEPKDKVEVAPCGLWVGINQGANNLMKLEERSKAVHVQQTPLACTCQGEAPCGGECQNGEWGEWREWSPCSATCNDAYRFRRRRGLESS